jgi:phosphoribosyl-ATP pyrophosphohydrolase/phosphoribosyl-AMP cyclohydrolase
MGVELQLDKDGLIPAIAQDASSGEVLRLGYVSPGSLRRTLDGGSVEFYSRSREDLWHKGEVSGSYLHVRSVSTDCDGDTLLLQVAPTGPACHTGNSSCFFTTIEHFPDDFKRQDRGSGIVEDVFSVIRERQKEMPEGSDTSSLLSGGVTIVGKKVVEEAGEAAIAAAEGKQDELASEVADLFYHSLVLLAVAGLKPENIWAELRRRHESKSS